MWQPGVGIRRLILFSLSLLTLSCSSGDESGSLLLPVEPSPRLIVQAVEELLDLYRTAIRQEDIDRLREFLQIEDSLEACSFSQRKRQQQPSDNVTIMDAQTFCKTVSEDFRNLKILDLNQYDEHIDITSDTVTASFLEVTSVADPSLLEQQTRAVQTTFRLIRSEVDETTIFRIGEVVRAGPQFEVITPGQILAGHPARITVSATTKMFPLDDVEIEVPDTKITQTLSLADGRFHGFFIPPQQSPPQPLRIHLRRSNREDMVISHPYRLRVPGEGVVERIAETGFAEFFAVAVAPDETIWAGGRITNFLGGTVFQVRPGDAMATFTGAFFNDPNGLLTDLAFDSLERLHFVLLTPPPQPSGTVVLDPGQSTFCQTINVFDPAYPFLAPSGNPSPSTRALAAEDGDIWLFGSDGGVARVKSDFTLRDGQCIDVEIVFEEIWRRQNSDLLTNTVPALIAASDGAMWFGTALGLTRLQNGSFTPVLFKRQAERPENPETLETFFQAISDAIFAARPLASVAIGDTSFVETFGRPLIKEDLIFSAVEDRFNR